MAKHEALTIATGWYHVVLAARVLKNWYCSMITTVFLASQRHVKISFWVFCSSAECHMIFGGGGHLQEQSDWLRQTPYANSKRCGVVCVCLSVWRGRVREYKDKDGVNESVVVSVRDE